MFHIFFVLIIAGATIFSWYKMLFTVFTGEGALHFSYNYLDQPVKLGYQQGALLLSDILMIIFRDNILLYNIFLLSVTVIIGILFYFLVHKLTNSRQIAFISSIIFNTNSWIFFEFYGEGWYNKWLERPIWFLFIFPSFYFYIEYINKRKIKVLLLSLVLYMLGLYLGQYNVFFLPMFFFYTIGLYIPKINFKKIKVREKDLKDILIPIPFLIYSITLLLLDRYLPRLRYGPTTDAIYATSTASNFISTPISDIVDLVLKQLVLLTIPSQFIPLGIIDFKIGIKELYLPVLVLYLIASYFILIKKKYVPIIIASLFFITISLVLNIVIRQDIIRSMPDGYRYLYLASVGYSIFLGIFLYSLFNKGFLKLIIMLFLIWWVLTNRSLINARIDDKYRDFQAVRTSLAYIKSLSPQLHNDSIVVAPIQLSAWETDFAKTFYGKDTMYFYNRYYPDIEKKAIRPFDPKKDFILRYDKKLDKVVDETKNYKEVIKGSVWAKEIFW